MSISSCLSLISIVRGNFARLCRLNRCVSLGEKIFDFFFFFGMGSVWVLKCGCVWIQCHKWISQFMPTGWQAGSLKGRPYSMLSVFVCLFVSCLHHQL